MKATATLSIALFLFSGCAASKTNVGGVNPNVRGESAAAIWEEQLHRQPMTKNRAVVRAVRDGEVTIHADKTGTSAKVGSTLQQGGSVVTDKTATTDLFLGENGPVVRVTPNSEVRFVRLDLQNAGGGKNIINTMIEVRKGRMLGNVKKLEPESSYLVKTRAGVIRVRGTEFSVSADGTCNVVSGQVEVFRGRARTVLESGDTYLPTKRDLRQ